MRTSTYEDLQAHIQDSIVLGIRGNWLPGVMEHHSGVTIQQKPLSARRNHFQENSNPEEKQREKLVFREL